METLVAGTVCHRIGRDRWVTGVQTAKAPERLATELRRAIRMDGDLTDLTTPGRVMPH